jgi:ABC-type siderophore export system fused ATPase/permease subunit
MFAVNRLEVVVLVLWLVGIICALAYLARSSRRMAGVALVAVAIVVPVAGSLVAVAVFAMHARRGSLQHQPQ